MNSNLIIPLNTQITVKSQKLHVTSGDKGSIETFVTYVKVTELPKNIPLLINPKSFNPNTRVAKKIKETLTNKENMFHISNRGITISAKSVKVDKEKNQLSINLGNPLTNDSYTYGIVDGETIYKLLVESTDTTLKTQEGDDLRQYIKVEIITGVESQSTLQYPIF